MRGLWNWVIIAVVLGVAVINPIYRYGQDLPIVTLGLDLRGGVEVLLHAVPENGDAPSEDQMTGVEQVVHNRVDPNGTKEVYITRVGSDRLLLQVPGEENPDGVISVIGDTALLEFINVGNDAQSEGTDFYKEGTTERKPEFAKYETILTGADLKNAHSSFDQQNKPSIGFSFKTDSVGGEKSAADIFGEFTRDHVGQYLCVILDGKVLTCPTINGAIWGGDGQITGNMDRATVDRIVAQLNAGALPVPLTILQSSVVGPSLGQKAIDNSFNAGMIGLIIVLAFMIIFYRLPGLVANLALIMYVVLVLGFLSLINATLTLPGIAGFLLSVGMAIDANIIIFERFKEEIRWGKTLIAALEAAFARAWVAILDGHVTVLLASAVLYFYGTGPVKGFAVTLFLGTIFALYSGVFVTRNLLNVVVRHFPDLRLYAPHTSELEIPAERLSRGHYYHLVERTALWLALSFAGVAVGIAFLFVNTGKFGHPFNLGIDFTGGDSIILRFKEALPLEGQETADIVKKYSNGEPTVQVDAVDPHIVSIRMRMADATGAATDAAPVADAGEARATAADTAQFVALKTELGDAFGGYAAEGTEANPTVLSYSHVGPTVGAELIRNAVTALLLGLVLIFMFVLVRFSAWQFSLAAVLNILQDIMLLLAATAILGLEVNSSFIAVVLTIAGYSINDTIIIFDRIRENLRQFPAGTNLAQLCNLSLTQTLGRSIYTVLTVLFMTVTLLIFGGPNLYHFMMAMFVGLLIGSFSSIRFAAPLYLFFHNWSAQRAGQSLAVAGGPSVQLPVREATIDSFAAEVETGGATGVERPGSAAKSSARKQRRR